MQWKLCTNLKKRLAAMSIEVLLLGVLIGITLLGYLLAINSHGPTRLSVSYLIATLILAGTVWAIVQHVNSGLDRIKAEEYRRLERAKQEAEERMRTQELSLIESKKKMEAAAKINKIISQGTGYASTMINIELRDFSVELDVLIGRANQMKKDIDQLIEDFKKSKNDITKFPQSLSAIETALNNLDEAAKYYWLYFRSEDSNQEASREKIMRQKARQAYNSFKEAGSLITVTN